MEGGEAEGGKDAVCMIHFTWHRLTCPACRKRTYVLLDPAERFVGCEACGGTFWRAIAKVVECEAEIGRELDKGNK